MDRTGRIVLALCGCRRVGKDTVADWFLAPFSGQKLRLAPFEHVKISTAMKRCVAQLFDLSHDDVAGADKDTVHPRWGVAPRRIMQWFGTDVMQHHLSAELLPQAGRSFWVDKTVHDVRRHVVAGTHVVISDVRFPHELDALEAAFGSSVVSVFIERACPGSADGAVDAHESESGVVALRGRATAVVVNDGTRDELCRRVYDAVVAAAITA
jgi:hypothetical protein